MNDLDHIIEATRNAGAYSSDSFELPEKVTNEEPITGDWLISAIGLVFVAVCLSFLI